MKPDTTTKAQPSFEIKVKQIILERVEFSHKPDYLKLQGDQKPNPTPATIGLNFLPGSELNFAVRLTVATDEPEALYRYTVSYVAIMAISEGDPREVQEDMVKIGAHILMPFAREVIANLSARGRFGVTWLQPIDVNRLIKSGRKKGEAE